MFSASYIETLRVLTSLVDNKVDVEPHSTFFSKSVDRRQLCRYSADYIFSFVLCIYKHISMCSLLLLILKVSDLNKPLTLLNFGMQLIPLLQNDS